MTEVWKPVVGFEGAYEVSDLGRVRSLDRYVVQRTRHGGTMNRFFAGRVLRARWRGDYLAHGLAHPDGQKSESVHVLVAAAFIGPRPTGMQVCHDDGDSSRNVPSNLRYDTPKANSADTTKHGRRYSNKGQRHGLSRFVDSEIRDIRARVASGQTQTDVAVRYATSQGHVSAIVNKRRWTHV